jgi:hypothetical protein
LDQGGKYKKVPGKEGVPDWNNDSTIKKGKLKHDANGSGGYGLFQLTYDSEDPRFIEPRKWIWNWQDNTRQAIQELQEKVGMAQKLYNGLNSTYSYSSGTIPNYLHFSGLESIIITYYNGMSGWQVDRVKASGYDKNPRSCWKPLSSGWRFLPNVNNYVYEVSELVE